MPPLRLSGRPIGYLGLYCVRLGYQLTFAQYTTAHSPAPVDFPVSGLGSIALGYFTLFERFCFAYYCASPPPQSSIPFIEWLVLDYVWLGWLRLGYSMWFAQYSTAHPRPPSSPYFGNPSTEWLGLDYVRLH
jgi:hypothetical protein